MPSPGDLRASAQGAQGGSMRLLNRASSSAGVTSRGSDDFLDDEPESPARSHPVAEIFLNLASGRAAYSDQQLSRDATANNCVAAIARRCEDGFVVTWSDGFLALLDRLDCVSASAPPAAIYEKELRWRYGLSFLRFTAWHMFSALLLLALTLALVAGDAQPLLRTLPRASLYLAAVERAAVAFLLVEIWAHFRLFRAEKRCGRLAVQERLAE